MHNLMPMMIETRKVRKDMSYLLGILCKMSDVLEGLVWLSISFVCSKYISKTGFIL